MKLVNYFLGFNAAILAFFGYTQFITNMEMEVDKWIYAVIIVSILSATAMYNLVQGYNLHRKEIK
jgi:hypothetical protein